jgi:benzoate/toluate 1,2-dioxygenase subunit alpha
MQIEAVDSGAGRVADLRALRNRMRSWLVKNPAKGIYKMDRAAFTDATVYEIELRHFFERNWVFLAHESQLPNPHDFVTTRIGRVPVLLTRDRSGVVRCMVNACAHRGARVCREKSGNKKNFMCPFHGWTYSSAGQLLDVTDEAMGGYSAGFSRADHNLPQIARLESYRGFIFGSLASEVMPLGDYLAGAKTFIDLMVDQSPQGALEVIPGATRYRYRGNWKLQVENGLDGYHVTTVHANYFMTVQRRVAGQSKNATKAIDFSNFVQRDGGSFSFRNGHSVLWADYANFSDRPNFALLDWLTAHHGAEKALWMNKRIRNLQLFPNVFLMDQTSTQIRIIQPISVDQTEVVTYCVAPVGESAAARALRIRQYEDFFNASGMATPDDLTEFNNCQIGFASGDGRMNDMSRGSTRSASGAGRFGTGLNVDALMSGSATADEGIYVAIHEEWLARMTAAIDRECAELEAHGELEAAR